MFSMLKQIYSPANLNKLVKVGEINSHQLGIQSGLRSISTSNEVNNSDTLQKATSEKVKDSNKGNKKRLLSTLHHSVPLAAATTAASKDKSREFMSYFPDIVRDLTERTKKFSKSDSGKHAADARKHYAEVLQFNVPGGKKNRGLAVVQAFELLASKDMLTEDNIRLANYLGWCVEMLQAYFLIYDDIMDGSKTRRGQPCWYLQENIGNHAINDGLLIKQGIYQILKQHFSHLDCRVNLYELFEDTTFITTWGQHLDIQSSRRDVKEFNMDLYKSIVSNKTSYYTFFLPVAAAMHLAGYTDPETFRQVKTILLEMGYFFQIQDDFLDCFGDPEITGKVGTDIEEGKCTWLAVVFMQRATSAQKKVMSECYGKSDPECVRKVKDLYEEISLPNTYAIYEEDSYNMIKTHIQQTSRGVPHDIFLRIMEKIYRRDS